MPGRVAGFPGGAQDCPVGEGGTVEDEEGDFPARLLTHLPGEVLGDVEELVRDGQALPGEGGVPVFEPGKKRVVDGFLEQWAGVERLGRQFEGAIMAEGVKLGPVPGEALPVFPTGGGEAEEIGTLEGEE